MIFQIDFPDRLSVGQDTIVRGKVVFLDTGGGGDGAVVRIVEEQFEVIALAPEGSDARYQFVLVPLMNYHEIRFGQSLVKIQILQLIKFGREQRIRAAKVAYRGVPIFRPQILQAPVSRRFVNDNLVAPLNELGGVAAEEMRVAVIPVRQERLIEEDYFHACLNE